MKRLSTLLCSCAIALGVQAQVPTISPLPQQANWGEMAFKKDVQYKLVGDAQADKDALELLKNNLNVTEATNQSSITLTIGEKGDKAVKKYAKQIPAHAEGYYLKVTPNEVIIAGNDESGTY